MAIRSGLGTTYGMKAESVYGTAVTPDKFTYYNSEGLKLEQGEIKSPFLGAVTLATSQVSTYTSGASGPIEFPFFNKGMGPLLKQAFGTVADAQVGGTAEYTHTYTIDKTAGKAGLSATLQVLKPNTEGSLVNPFTVEGAKCVGFEIMMSEKGLLVLKTDWICETGTFGTSLASASYATNLSMFNWASTSITLNGTAFYAKSFSVKCGWSVDDDRRGLSQTLRKEPILNASPGIPVTGSMAGEFVDLTAYNMFVAGSFQPIILTCTGATIPTTSNPYKVVVTIQNARLTGDTPVVGGPGILEMPVTFEGADDGTNSILKCVTNNDETTGS